MEVHDVQNVEYVDAVCLDKGILLDDGTATITTIDGESVPVTFIVSQQLEDDNDGEKSGSSDGDIISGDISGELKNEDSGDQSYTLHFPSDGKQEETSYIVEDHEDGIISKEKPSNDGSGHEITESPALGVSTDSMGKLEDFMDVVTTYKCKFCRFTCPWKSGLMSHIRCCHIKEKDSAKEMKAVAAIPDKVIQSRPTKETIKKTNDIPKKKETPTTSSKVTTEEASNSSVGSSMEEHSIFLCGQCSDGFASLEECKRHMIEDHKLKIPEEPEKVVRKQRGKHKTRQPKEEKTSPPKKRVKKEAPSPKESKKRKSMYMSLEDELDCCIKRKLRSGYVNDRAFRCTKSGCGHRFTSDSNLTYHQNSHSGDSEKPFSCHECSEGFQHWRGLAMHLWRMHTIDIDLYACTECDYKAFSFFKVENHRKIHSDERPYMCEQCGKSFKQISQLRNHVVIHLDRKNLPEKRWYSEQQCRTCGRTFSDTKCLRKHEQAVHSRLKPFVCTFCGHTSARKAMLELHMRHHTGEKPYMCEVCDYRTGDHNSLRRHRMRHTGDKPYKCPHCPYACIQAISIKTHLRNKHPGMDGLYSCALCTFKTVSKDSFLHHMEDHKRFSELPPPAPPSSLPQGTATTCSSTKVETAAESTTPEQSDSTQTDNALQQLEGILPGNITAAQLIYSCLNAMSQDGSAAQISLPAGVTLNLPTTAITNSDGTQTITIQVPSGQESSEGEPYYFTIQQQDGTTAVVLPNATEGAPQLVECVDLAEQDSISGKIVL